MAQMIDKATAIDTVMSKLAALPVGSCLDLRTYKRNRSVLIKRTGDDVFLVLENGFHEERFESGLKKMRKLLKTLLKREFPRSNKIRLYNLGPCDAEESAALKRKKI